MEKIEYGIVFTDLHMPEIDGYALVKTLRGREEQKGHNEDRMPIVVLTADVQMAQRQVYLAEGFDECLLKPVSLGQLRRLLMRWGLLKDKSEVPAAPALQSKSSGGGSVIDVDALIEQMGTDRAGAIEMLGLFPEMMAPIMDQIRSTNAARDFTGLREAAHSLKGAARSACCVVLGDLAAQLQDESEEQKPNDALVASLGEEFARVEQAIRKL